MRAVAVRENIRDLIPDAADRLLTRYGFKKMTMDDLAQEVGIAKGTIYLHFSSEEAVALTRVDRIINELCKRLSDIARSPETPAERLRAMLMLRVLFRFDSVQSYAESLNEQLAAIRPALQTRRKKYFQEEAQILVEVLESGRREKAFFFKDAERAARALLTATNGLLPSNLSAEELGDRRDIEERVSQIAELLVGGLSVNNKKER